MKYSFKELVDIQMLQELTDELYSAASIPSAVITMDGEVLTVSGWQRICTKFHRQHPETQKDCIETNTTIRNQLDAGEPFSIYKCPRGLFDASSPILIDGEHIANIFSGQIFLEPPDETTEQFFREQARKFGFDETEYIKAFQEIPIFTEKKFRAGIAFLTKLAQLVANMGLTRLNELKSMKALQESERNLSITLDSIGDAVMATDIEGKITRMNPVAEHLTGWTIGEAQGIALNKVFNIVNARTKKEAVNPVRHVIETGKVIGLANHTLLIAKNGSRYQIADSAAPIQDDIGGILGVVLVFRDVTKEYRMREAVRKSEERYRLTFNTSPNAINLNNLEDGIYIDINESFTRIMGYSREDIIGKSSIEFNIWNDLKDRARLVSGLKKHGAVENLKADFIGKDGQIITGLMSARLMHIDNQETILSITRDITEQGKLEVQLQQAQKMESIGTLAGGIAHDFNNILFPIVGHTEMLMDDLSEEKSSIRNSLKEIYSGTLRARDLVKQILTFSRQQKNKPKLMKIQPIIKEAMKLIRSTIPATISITQNLNLDCGAVKADPTQIHQIVMNLVTNAYHAMEETGGELTVNLKEIELGEYDLITPDMIPGLYACLSIADTGRGINKAVMDRIFDPFFTTKEKGKGTGMGLSVVHGIVKSMNGEIKAYSEPGRGTEFHVYLPVAKHSFQERVTHSNAEILGGMEQILLADDEEAILTMEKQMLERLGYHVTSRTSSIEALEAFRDNPDKFDLVITDMAMPNMSGDRLAAELTKISPDIPILLCTGFSETMTEEKAASLGIKGFLLKPIVMKDLSQKIREVLDIDKKHIVKR